MDQRTRQLAEACLRERNCPLALHFFHLEGGRLVRPRVQSPPAREPDGIPALFREAEAQATNLFNNTNLLTPTLSIEPGLATFLNPQETESTPRIVTVGTRIFW